MSGLRLVNRLALAIADGAARADVECYAFQLKAGGRNVYDISRANQEPFDKAETAHCIRTATQAARYIEARGDVFDFRMVREAANKNIVWFEDKKVRP